MENYPVSIRIEVVDLPQMGKGTCNVTLVINGKNHEFSSHMSNLLTFRIREQRKSEAGLPNKAQYWWPKYEGTEFTCDRLSDNRKAGPLAYVYFTSNGKYESHRISLVEERGAANLTPDRAEVAEQVWKHWYYRAKEYNRVRQVDNGRVVV